MRFVLLAALSVAIAACGGAPPTGLAAELPGSTWTLERVVLPDDGGVLRGDGERVSFAADGSLTVSSCNACSGTYRVRRGQLEPGPLACTRRGCPADAVELERFFSGPLAMRRDGAYLVLDAITDDADGAQILLVPAGTP